MKSIKIGVKDLKNKATQVIREVREKHTQYVITVDGVPAAVITPFEVVQASEIKQKQKAAFENAMKIATQVGEKWQDDVSAVDAIREQRRG